MPVLELSMDKAGQESSYNSNTPPILASIAMPSMGCQGEQADAIHFLLNSKSSSVNDTCIVVFVGQAVVK